MGPRSITQHAVLRRAARSRTQGGSQLSAREREVVEFVGQGYANQEIAEIMCLTAHTVRNHLNSIMHKLQLSDRFELALWAVGSADRESPGCAELRKKRRYGISLPVRYRILHGRQIGDVGTGEALNISVSGVWFTTERTAKLDGWLRLSIDWPILLNRVHRLQLVIEGPVIRNDERGAALAVARHEFRTRSSN